MTLSCTYLDYHLYTYFESFLTKKLEPTQPKDFYSYYEAKPDKTYAVLKFEVKNIGSTDLDVENVLSAKAIVDDKYEYTGTEIIEKDGDLSSYGRIEPMTSNYAYAKIEIPDNVLDKKIIFKLATAGETRLVDLDKK